jgi:DNA-binding CsgD family transcriptional regulator
MTPRPRRHSALDVALLDRWLEAFNAHDVDALELLSDPDIEVVPLGRAVTIPAGTSFHGYQGLRSLVSPGFERWPRLRVEAEQIETMGDSLIASILFVLDDGRAPATTDHCANVYRTRGGLMRYIQSFETTAAAKASIKARGAQLLTPREREIFALLAEGLNAQRVAERLVLSPFTVRTHIRNAKDKLGAKTTGQAIAIAVRADDD